MINAAPAKNYVDVPLLMCGPQPIERWLDHVASNVACQ